MKIIIYIILFAITVANMATNGQMAELLGFSSSSPVYTRISYLICHTNILHLIINLFAIYKMREYAEAKIETMINGKVTRYIMPAMIMCAVLATFGSEMNLPTVGLSGVLFAFIGFVTVIIHNKFSIYYIAITIIFNAIGYFIGNVNIFIHIIAFAYGAAIATPAVIYELERVSTHQRRTE